VGFVFGSKFVITYNIFTSKFSPWVFLAWVPFGMIMLFNATRKVIFDTKSRTFLVKVWGIVFKKSTWEKLERYSVGPRIIEHDYRNHNRAMNYGHPLYLYFNNSRVWVAQAEESEALKELANAIKEMLKARM